jgi:YebC/PmpR family DNA-binding regulatory protein
MAGHSHWANIAHKKSAIDAKRGKLWSKLAKGIIIAAKAGGGDPNANLRLRYAIIDAKAGNMPKDTIDRAIKKGTGELEGVNYEEILYEGYGPGGVAVLCDILTDNRNRTAPEVRKIFEMAGGKLGGAGSVAWMFDRKGLLVIPAGQTDEESLMDLALEAGADDVQHIGETFATSATRSKKPASRPRSARSPASPRTTWISMPTPVAPSSSSWKRSTTTTTSKRSPPTSTSPTKRWPRSKRRNPHVGRRAINLLSGVNLT